MKIAIIDTGYDERSVINSNNIRIYKNLIYDIDCIDEHGHGTMCINTIQEKCADVEIVPIKVFDKYGKGSSDNLKEVLEKIFYTDINIVCIPASFSFNNKQEISDINSILYKLYKKKIVVIASASNNPHLEKISMPAINKHVIGAKGEIDIECESSFYYFGNSRIQFRGCRKSKLTKSINNTYEWFGNNSRCCILAAIECKKMIDDFGINIFFEKIKKDAFKLQRNDFIDYGHIDKIEKEKLEEKLVEIINKEYSVRLCVYDLKKFGVFNNITGIGKHNIINLLDRIAIELNVSLYDLYYEDFYAIDKIVQVIYRRLRKER